MTYSNGDIRKSLQEREAYQRALERNGTSHRVNGHAEPDDCPKVLTSKEFTAGFVPPDYFIEGMLQRRFIYSMTGHAGGGKTAVALTIHQFSTSQEEQTIGSYKVRLGKSLYFVGENPDDIRARVMASGRASIDDNSLYIVGVFDIGAMLEIIRRQIADKGELQSIFVDTSAAYFLQYDENSNAQIGEHARMLRELTLFPGGPCVIVLCHPTKAASDQENMVPRGGSAFLGEIDGNLTIMPTGEDTCELHHTSKFRGVGFDPVSFKLIKASSKDLTDSHGNRIMTVRADPMSEEDQKVQTKKNIERENSVLVAMLDKGQMSVADVAMAAGLVSAAGAPQKSTTHRILTRLKGLKPALTKNGRSGWEITGDGEAEAEKAQRKGNYDE